MSSSGIADNIQRATWDAIAKEYDRQWRTREHRETERHRGRHREAAGIKL